jgi:hypothetical protein
MNFHDFKNEVMRLAKAENVAHEVPCDNTLFYLWEKKMKPSNVVFWFC